MTDSKTALIIGAGPAGLTAAYELLQRTGVRPIVLEQSHAMGGISRTINYKGNRIDIGGHRFFSKSDRVMRWWLDMLPPEEAAAPITLAYQNQRRALPDTAASATDPDQRFLIRPRKSRIYFLRRFFDYPLQLSLDTLTKLGLWRTAKIGASYVYSMLAPIKPEKTLEEFFINRFGRQLYRTFFQSYTEKVWGVPCHQISAEWGAQRIKGLSILKALVHMLKKLKPKKKQQTDLAQKDTETSLIEQFLYPKYGPGQLWETCAAKVVLQGGQIHTGWTVDKLYTEGNRITAVEAIHESGARRCFEADYVFSTMPMKELVRALDTPVPAPVREVSEGLQYRDFITVGLLLNTLQIHEETPQGRQLLRDNWIYIQEPDVQVGRMQIFNNWSPYMVADPSKVWIGLEYFCYDTDAIWKLPDADMIALATRELEKIGILAASDVVDATVIRVPKTYPAYFGTYDRFAELRAWLDGFENLFLVGRNGMHKYNNQDHSMLTAMTAVDNIQAGRIDKSNLWSVNTEQEYHEEKVPEQQIEASLINLAQVHRQEAEAEHAPTELPTR